MRHDPKRTVAEPKDLPALTGDENGEQRVARSATWERARVLFVRSLRGRSHTKLEDTKEGHLELAVAALDRFAAKTIDRVAAGGGR